MYDQHLRLLAAHYSNMDDGRSDSAGYVANYFHELIALTKPALFVEAGAYKAEASRRVRQDHPSCRVVAFEANPYNFERYSEEIGLAAAGIDYRNLAVTDTAGPVTFHLRSRQDGEELRKVTGNSSLLRRQNTDTEYEDLTVEGVTLDGFFGIDAQEPVCLWIDVEGASGHVLRGATALLRRTELVLIEVEEKLMWEGQWRSIDVIEFFLDAGFVPLTRDAEYNQQYNIIFVREDVYERPDVLWSHELHTNYLTQHMGVT
jgi:FkbM family methyltransferase